MKQKITLVYAAVWLLFVCFFFSCSKHDKRQIIPENLPNKNATKKNSARLSNGDYTCGDFIDGQYAGVGHYFYPTYPLNFDAVASNVRIDISVSVSEVPNRFTVYDASGAVVVTSGWMGYANYPGPWGASLSTTNTGLLSFLRGASGTYTLVIETSTPSNTTDFWSATISCISPAGPPDPTDPTNPMCSCNSGFFSGQYAGSSFYTYPERTLDLRCTNTGTTINVNCEPLGVPNRFSIYDNAGNLIKTTGWIGYASYRGPWGMSLNKGGQTLTFQRGSNSTIYVLRVETTRDARYESNTDSWQTTVGCLQ